MLIIIQSGALWVDEHFYRLKERGSLGLIHERERERERVIKIERKSDGEGKVGWEEDSANQISDHCNSPHSLSLSLSLST